MTAKRFRASVVRDDKTTGTAVELPFNPKDVFGRVRVPVLATIRGHTYTTTTCSRGGSYWIPLSKVNRERVGVAAGDRVMVTLDPLNGGSGDTNHDTVAGVSSEAVKKKTGRGWSEWFAVLNKAGARKLQHKDIAILLREKHDVEPWWAQQVTVGYEQACLGRRPHEKPGGYEIGASKTVKVPLAKLYRAWSDTRPRKRWLSDWDFEVRKATVNRSMRITWVDGVTHVDAYFHDKGGEKSQVTVQHKKLKDSKAAEKAKKMWAGHLAGLKEMLE